MKKQNIRKYGKPPYRVVLVHGGPGASGEMAPVARVLSGEMGVLEPLQTEATLDGQVEELRLQVEKNAALPAVLVGYSWGAWLCFILAARHPRLAAKLVLVGSGGFLAEYGARTEETRMSRLTAAEKAEIQAIRSADAEDPAGSRAAFARFGEIFSRADTFEPIEDEPEEIEFRPDIYEGVWKQAAALRKSGRLLDLGNRIQCPVTALHGDYDPHPAEGVSAPLSAVLKSFKFVLLEKCGHKPWMERHARDAFFRSLREELSDVSSA